MNKYIHMLVESYFDSTEQMNQLIKNTKALQRAEEKSKESRKDFIMNVLGPKAYKKYDNNGTFAPVPLSSIKLTKNDFDLMNTSLGENKTEKLIKMIKDSKYPNIGFYLIDNGMGNPYISTRIIFKTMDEVIDFFYTILHCFKKVYKTEEINWKPIVDKFKKYLK